MGWQFRCINNHTWTVGAAPVGDATLPNCPICFKTALLPTDPPPAPSLDDTLTGDALRALQTQNLPREGPATMPAPAPKSPPVESELQQTLLPPLPPFASLPEAFGPTLADAPTPSLNVSDTLPLAPSAHPAEPENSIALDETLTNPFPTAPASPTPAASPSVSDPGADTLVGARLPAEPTEIGKAPDIEFEQRPTVADKKRDDRDRTKQMRAGPVPSPRPTAPSPLPTPVDGYDILGVLGRGGMGIVYKARQIKLDRVVALKMILSASHTAPAERARFEAEARAVARMKHPNILQIFEVGTSYAGQPYFSLEFVEGGTLQDRLEKYALPPRDAAAMTEILARALHYAHTQGVLHRDIKPGNVLLTGDGVPKISDFGLAKRLDHEESINPNDLVVGTPMYMPPEQASAKTPVGPTADIYSLGATLYEMLVGRPPFRGTTVLDTLKMVQNDEPIAPRRLQPTIPADLQTICLKCLSKDPRHRYQTAEDFANDLRNYLEGRPIAARPVSTLEKAWKWTRRNPAAASLIAVSVVSLLGFAIGGASFAVIEKHRADDLARAHAQIMKEKEQVVASRKEALEFYAATQEALETSVHLARDRMLRDAKLDSDARKLVDAALEHFDRLAKRKSTDPQLNVHVARTLQLAGNLREKLGDYVQAEQDLAGAERLYQDLLKTTPDRKDEWERSLARLYLDQATVFRVGKKHREADEAMRKMQALLNPNARFELAGSYNNSASLALQRGEFSLAEENYLYAMLYFNDLAHQNPAEVRYKLELASVQNNLAQMWTLPGLADADKAAAYYEEAVATLAPLAEQHRDIPACRRELGRAYMNRGVFFTNQDRFADADKDLRQAALIFENLASADPGVADYPHLYATTERNLAHLLRRQNDWAGARAAYELAEPRLRKLAAEQPKSADYRADLARCTQDLARVMQNQVRDAAVRIRKAPDDPALVRLVADTEETWYHSFELWQKLNKEFRGEVLYAAGLVKTHGQLCNYHKALANIFRRAKPTEAEAHLQKRVKLRQDMLARMPEDAMLKDQLAEALLALALMRVEMKQYATSAAAIAELAATLPADRELYPIAAGCLAQCLAIADKSLIGTERDQTLKTYGDRAMNMLEAAHAAGWRDTTYLHSHPLLAPLRERPEYAPRLEKLK